MAKAPARKRAATRKTSASQGGNPPASTRFQPGQSGNPAGRPPKERSLLRHVEKELDAEVQITEGDEVLRLTKREVLAKRMVNSALTGDARAIASLMRLLGTATDSHDQASATVPLESVMNFLTRRLPAGEGDAA